MEVDHVRPRSKGGDNTI
ncbi:MAG: hypothetical protein MGU50_05145 [Trichodesmium sp. MAG_R02]|nr:hypothetical protein [Trichodesmium sp. MAG_R02]